MPDTASLSALVHASPTYHASYLQTRSAVFTTVTLRSLQSRGVKILPACSAATVFLREGELGGIEELRGAFQCLYSQMEKCVPPKILTMPFYRKWGRKKIQPRYASSGCYEPPSPVTGDEGIKLSVEQCLVLLKVQHMVPRWRIDREGHRRIYCCWAHDIEKSPSRGEGKRHEMVFEPRSVGSELKALRLRKPPVLVMLSSDEKGAHVRNYYHG